MFQNHHRNVSFLSAKKQDDRENWSGIQIPLHFHLSAVTWPLTPVSAELLDYGSRDWKVG